MMLSLGLSLLTALLLVQVNAQTHDELSEQYTYNAQLNGDRYTMFYSYDADMSILRIAVLVQTTGWIGLGVSPNGQMPGSDVVMGWVNNSGQVFLQDRYAFARTLPRLDASQDWVLKGGSEEGGFTTLEFERKLDTCDEEDLPINFGDTTYLIYSYHNEDPVNDQQFSQHQFEGSLMINLFGQPESVPPLPDGTQNFDINNQNVTIPAKDTTYLCTLMELPRVFQNKTHYIVKYEPILSTESIRHVHHVLVFLCEGLNYTGHPEVGINRECDGITREVAPCRFATLIAAWAVGGNDFTFPEGIALPIGGEDKIHTHVLIEMHYDNPEVLSGIVDSSGIRFFYTDEPPQQRAAILTLGHQIIGHMIVPPRVERYTVNGYCNQRCTDTFLPDQGITAFANLLHLHNVGAELVLRHIRNGEELDPIDINRNYDFDFQQLNFIPSVQILPGDEMILECVYNSANRNFTSFGGESSRDEMCFSFLFYYPATDLSYCISFTNPQAYAPWLDTYVPSDQQFALSSAAEGNISNARPVFDSLDWTEESYRMFETIGQTGQQFQICSAPATGNGYTERTQPVTVERPLEQTDNCREDSGAATLYGSVITMLLYWVMVAII